MRKYLRRPLTIISWVLYPFILIGAIVYAVDYIDDLFDVKQGESPIQLALVATALGGLLLIGALYQPRLPEAPVQRLIGKLLLGSAVFYTTTALLIEVVNSQDSKDLSTFDWIVIILTSISIGIAAILLAAGLVLLIGHLRRI